MASEVLTLIANMMLEPHKTWTGFWPGLDRIGIYRKQERLITLRKKIVILSKHMFFLNQVGTSVLTNNQLDVKVLLSFRIESGAWVMQRDYKCTKYKNIDAMN